MARRSVLMGVAVLALVASLLFAPAETLGEQVAPTHELRVEKPVFWEAKILGGQRPGNPALCGIEGPCPEFTLEIADPGERLRVAVDHDNVDDLILVQLFAPGDPDPVAEQTTWNPGDPAAGENHQAAEVVAEKPATGSWRVRIVPGCGEICGPVRLRAKLERAQHAVKDGRLLRPDLRAEPPFDFAFRCRDDESVQAGMTCLRFAFGPHNVGDGPLAFNFGSWDPATNSGTVVQRIYRSDSTPYDYSDNPYVDGSSGFTYGLHQEHRHFHVGDDAYSTQQLFSVTGTSDMVAVGQAEKTGFCLMDSGIARWRGFDQDRRTWAGAECVPPNNPPQMGLSKGWRDIYFRNVHGNYVSFPTEKGAPIPGRYVVQVQFDPKNHLVEKHENDNTGYAYIKVTNGTVNTLERGQGLHPWDPEKVVCGELGC